MKKSSSKSNSNSSSKKDQGGRRSAAASSDRNNTIVAAKETDSLLHFNTSNSIRSRRSPLLVQPTSNNNNKNGYFRSMNNNSNNSNSSASDNAAAGEEEAVRSLLEQPLTGSLGGGSTTDDDGYDAGNEGGYQSITDNEDPFSMGAAAVVSANPPLHHTTDLLSMDLQQGTMHSVAGGGITTDPSSLRYSSSQLSTTDNEVTTTTATRGGTTLGSSLDQQHSTTTKSKISSSSSSSGDQIMGIGSGGGAIIIPAASSSAAAGHHAGHQAGGGYESSGNQSSSSTSGGGAAGARKSLSDGGAESSASRGSTGLQRTTTSGSSPYQHQQQQPPPPVAGSSYSDPHDAAPPLLEIPEEIYAVRKAALQVLKPLNKTWVVISVGFALTVLFGMARWTRLLPKLPYWFIVLPCWSAHVGLLWLHMLSARALARFIAEANDSRQRPDSRDHLNRTEYLPLLQRSLKFGLKTGLLSFAVFLFEILMYIRVARGSISLGAAFAPLWVLVTVGIVDGLICKTQHVLRVVCWILTFCAMLMTVLKVDYGWDAIRWRVVVSPVVTVLSIASCALVYIVYGHQIGYYRLTESQLTAGNLYSLAALICIVLIVMIGEVIPLSRPVEIETRLFVVILAPLVVALVGMGAWVVSRDEFGRLLLYGGQSAVHPMKLRWEARGWTSVQGKGVTVIPMFGEVSFQPLEKKPVEHAVEMLTCCTCYPYEDEDEETTLTGTMDKLDHPYLDPSSSLQQGSYGLVRR